jgi:hypothetical protein
MKIQQSAFLVKNSIGEFIGIVAFDADSTMALVAAESAWGTFGRYKELDAEELRTLPSSGLSIFTATVQPEQA